MIYICALLFIIYNTILFVYSKSLYHETKNIIPFIIVSTPINFAIFYVSIYITNFTYDYFIMLAFLLFYTIEFRILFKQSYIKIFFGTLSYAINIFAMRTIILAIISLANQVPISTAIQQLDVRLLTMLITLFLRPFTILQAMKAVKKDQIFMIFSSKDNLHFSLGILSLTFAYQLATSFLLDIHTDSLNVTIFLLSTGIFAIVVYLVTMVHTYEFSKLQLHIKDVNRLRSEYKKEEKQLKELKKSADIDPFTGAYIRKIADLKLKTYMEGSKKFYVVFFDIDGLKIANDAYGHDEGDFYIKKVSNILLSIFDSDTVVRMGGDEFLILGTEGDEYSLSEKVLQAYEFAKQISAKYEKPYDTSISYGIVLVDEKNTLSEQEIIALVDKKMYDFKRERKKAR